MLFLVAHRTPSTVLVRWMVIAAQIFTFLSWVTPASATDMRALAAPITGNVFRDYNANGVRDTGDGSSTSIDVGVKGIKVFAYDINNGQVGVATTDAEGNYTLTPGDSGVGPYRIEFNLPLGFVDGPSGKYSSVQFVKGGERADLGIVAPGDYCQSDPSVVTNCYIYGFQLEPGEPFTDANGNGKYDADETYIDLNRNGKWDALPNAHALLQMPLSASAAKEGKDNLLPTTLALAKDMGATYGLGWQPSLKQIYASAYLKRHTGFGPLGTGGIYRVDMRSSPTTVTPMADLNALFGPNTAGADPHPGADLFTDAASLNKIGKLSLGDLDLSPDGKTLYVVNLADKTIYALPAYPVLPTAQNTRKFAAPINTITNCAADEVRPFGLGVHIDGSVFLGAVCSAEATQKKEDLRAYVWRLDPTTSQWRTIIDVALTTVRPFWKAWKDIDNLGSYVQPMLTDIAFDGPDMVLGFRDRYSDQTPAAGKRVEDAPFPHGYGDVLRACVGALPGTWDLESKGQCGGITTRGATAGGAAVNFLYPEFYFEEYASDKGLDEAALGGLAQVPGRSFVLSSAYDPVVFDAAGNWKYNRYNEAGLQRYDNTTGQTLGTYAVYHADTVQRGTFGKAGGMGDIEVLCDGGPIEIGNRVWIDQDGDGLQGADEPPVANVRVQLLYDDGTPVKDANGAPAIATTNAAGEYYFQNDPRLPSRTDGSLIYISSNPNATVAAEKGLVPFTDYQLKIEMNQPVLNLYSLTQPDVSANGRDTIDSDGVLSADKSVASVSMTTSGPGINNHSYDFGFRAGVSLGNRVWYDTNNDGIDNDGLPGPTVTRGEGVSGVEVWLFMDKNNNGQLDASERVLTTTTNGVGFYSFTGLAVGNYFVMLPPQNFQPGGALFEYQNSTPVFDDTDSPTDPNYLNHGMAYGALGRDSSAYVASKIVKLTVGAEPQTEIDNDDGNSNQTIDFGVYKVGLGNLVWEDRNNNGRRDTGETSMPNVAVRLCTADGNTVLQQTATDADGQYAFTNLLAGVPYVVGITPPSTPAGTLPYQSSADVATSADPNSNVDDDDNGVVVGNSPCGGIRSNPVTLGAGDLGLISNTQVMTNLAATFDPTVDFGLFRPAHLGNYVWFDVEETGEDGSADPDENGVNGVTVTLLYSDGVKYVPYPFGANTQTTVNGPDGKPGFYQFKDLLAGDYQVQFGAPPQWAFTAQHSAADTEDSDADANGLVTGIHLQPGEMNDTIDAGIRVPLALGNRVFIDNNNDGIDNDGALAVLGSSVGIPNVKVRVYYDLNGNGRIDGVDHLVDELMTDAGGYYTSMGNISGSFMVQLPPQNFLPGGALEFCTSSTGNGVAITDNNQNFDDDGEPDAALGWVSRPITLTPFAEPTNDGDNGLNGNNNNYSVDFGCVALAELGNRVWLDANNNGVQDGAENNNVAGVVVSLMSAVNNAAVMTTTTDGLGLYSFTKVPPGNYYVHFNLPLAFTRSPANVAGVNDTADSDAVVATGDTPQTNLVIGERDQSWDAGLVPKAGLGDRIWEDRNHNGLQDAGELGIPGVTVNLRVNGNVVATQATSAEGFYLFNGLAVNTPYEVCVVLPVGYQFTIPDANNNLSNTFDSDANGTTGCLPIRQMAAGEGYPHHDAGLWRSAGLGNYTWIDLNRDGLQGLDENPLAEVTVKLYQAGNVINQMQTDGQGFYHFTGLQPGVYSLTFDLPQGYERSLRDVLGNSQAAQDSDADEATGATDLITLQSGQDDLAWDAGYIPLTSLGDFVWEDRNHNGLQDADEPGVPNVNVTLLDKDGSVLRTQMTDGQGHYLFDQLAPSEYTLIFTPPNGYAFTQRAAGTLPEGDSNVNELTSQTERIVFTPGQSRLDIDAGLWRPVSLGDTIWEDVNDNGQQNGDEPGVNDVAITLLNSAGQTVAVQHSATTLNGSGAYTFANLIPSTYVVSFTAPAGYLFGRPMQGPDESNSDAIPNTVLDNSAATRAYPLQAGESNPTVDAGLVRCTRLGNRVWLDANLNGRQDSNETAAVPTTTLKLFNADSNMLIAQYVTDASGHYDFPCIPPGRYYIQSEAPEDHEWTGHAIAGNDLVDSDIDNATGRTPVIPLAPGEQNNNVDLGLILQADLGNLVWEDRNFNGRQDEGEPPVPGVTVTLYADGQPIGTQVTNANGKYAFSGLRARVPYTLSFALPKGYLWTKQQAVGVAPEMDSNVLRADNTTLPIVLEPGDKDMTIDAGIFLPAALGDYVWEDRNHNGLQDGDEPGVNDVVVSLLDTHGHVIDVQRSTTFLGHDGYYSFTNVISGSYVISFSVPSDQVYLFTTPKSGNNEAINNDAVPLTRTARVAVTQVYTVKTGDDIPTVDAGLVLPASLGDRVWVDANSNGVQDPDEHTSISNTVVSLYDAVSGVFVVSTTTSITGSYWITDLLPGGYCVRFAWPNGYVTTLGNEGADDALDSDVTLKTGCAITVLAPGEEDLSLDVGANIPARLGDRVWFDLDRDGNQDNLTGEHGMGGVTVILRYEDRFVTQTTTNADGYYNFPELLPLVPYTLQFSLPPQMSWTRHHASAVSNEVNSDVDANGQTQPIILLPAASNLHVDAGMQSKLGLEEYPTTSGPLGFIGSDKCITYTLVVTNNTTELVSNMIVTDVMPEGMAFSHGEIKPLPNDEMTLIWQVGKVQAGYSASSQFVACAVSDDVSSFVNTAVLQGGVHAGIVAADESEVPFSPTAIRLKRFVAQQVSEGSTGTRVLWETTAEQDTFGFQVWRSQTAQRSDAVLVTSAFIPAQGRVGGAVYEVNDAEANPDAIYHYWLAETELSGAVREYGPVMVSQSLADEMPVTAMPSTQVALAGGVPVVPLTPTVPLNAPQQADGTGPLNTLSAPTVAVQVQLVATQAPVVHAAFDQLQSTNGSEARSVVAVSPVIAAAVPIATAQRAAPLAMATQSGKKLLTHSALGRPVPAPAPMAVVNATPVLAPVIEAVPQWGMRFAVVVVIVLGGVGLYVRVRSRRNAPKF